MDVSEDARDAPDKLAVAVTSSARCSVWTTVTMCSRGTAMMQARVMPCYSRILVH